MTDPSRRGLFGLLAGVAAAPLVGWGAGRTYPHVATLVGKMGPETDMLALEGMSQKIASELFYGAADVPTVFSGFSVIHA